MVCLAGAFVTILPVICWEWEMQAARITLLQAQERQDLGEIDQLKRMNTELEVECNSLNQ